MTPKISLGALDLDAAEVHLLVRLKADDFGRSVFMRHVAHGILLAEASPTPATLGCVLTLRDGRWERMRAFSELVNHYGPARTPWQRQRHGQERLEYARANFMTPVPVAASFDALDPMLSGWPCTAIGARRASF
jgi:hypothetical protein